MVNEREKFKVTLPFITVLELTDFNGRIAIGIFAKSNNKVTFVPPYLTKRNRRKIEKVLGTNPISLTIGGSELIGSLIAINSKGAVVSSIILDYEISSMEESGLKVGLLDDRLNAAGNNILCNDHGAIVNPGLSNQSVKVIKETLGVNVAKSTIAGLPTVGSAAFATSAGAIIHPKINEEEREILIDVLKVEINPATLNNGNPFVGSGIVGNTSGALVGKFTNGLELGRIEEALHYY